MIDADQFREILEDHGYPVRTSGAGYTACCPAHPDSTPSLGFRDGDESVLVVICRAGCASEDVLREVGLTWADVLTDDAESYEPAPAEDFTPATSSAPPANDAVYVYRDEHGAPIGRVVRRANPKRFHQEHWTGDGYVIGAPPGGFPLYRLPEVIAAVKAERTILLCEGERDVETAEKLGYVATTNAGGAAQKWKDEFSQYLAGADVLIPRDRDKAGYEHAEKVAASLTGVARSVRIVDVAAGKDLTDHAAAGFGIDDLRPVTVERRYQPIDWHKAWNETPDAVEWLVYHVFERGRLYALCSPAKSGKSLFIQDIVASLVTGRAVVLGQPNVLPGPIRVLYIDHENTQADIVERFRLMGYQPGDLGNLIYLSLQNLPPLDTAQGGAALLDEAHFHRPDMIVLDTVSRVVQGEENSADTIKNLYRHSLLPLKAEGIAMLRIDHEGKDPAAGQRGTSAKNDDVDTVLRLATVGKPTEAGEVRLSLKVERQRSGHHPEEIALVRRLNPLRHERIDVVEEFSDVDRIMASLDDLGVPLDFGRDRARERLSEQGIKARNETIGAALKLRRERAEDLSPAGASTDDLGMANNTRPDQESVKSETPGRTRPGRLGDSGDGTPGVQQGPPVRPSPHPMVGTGDGCPDESKTDEQVCAKCGATPSVPIHFENGDVIPLCFDHFQAARKSAA